MAYVELACRIVIGLTFLSAGISKLRDREAFAQATRRLLLARIRNHRAVANAVLAAELAVAGLLIVPVPLIVVAGFAIATALSTAFAVATVGALRRGVHVPCRCFGSREEPLAAAHVVRDVLLVLTALAGMAGVTGPGPSMQAAGVAVAGAAGVTGAFLLIFLDDFRQLFQADSRNWESTAKKG